MPLTCPLPRIEKDGHGKIGVTVQRNRPNGALRA